MGDKIAPCGAHVFKIIVPDILPLIATLCGRLERKSLIHRISPPLTPKSINHCIKI